MQITAENVFTKTTRSYASEATCISKVKEFLHTGAPDHPEYQNFLRTGLYWVVIEKEGRFTPVFFCNMDFAHKVNFNFLAVAQKGWLINGM